jgi:gluconate 2-dehydrogenase gamma chain
MYRGGPWMEGTPRQGYPSRFTPQEVYRIAIREIDQHCKAASGRNFAQLPNDRQSHLLEQLEKDEIALPSLSSKFFFDLLWRNTDEGYFADPLYGGNRDKVGWKLLGFPGLPSSEYRHLVTSSEPYYAEPVSVLDVQTGKVPVDAEGFPKHVIIRRDRRN